MRATRILPIACLLGLSLHGCKDAEDLPPTDDGPARFVDATSLLPDVAVSTGDITLAVGGMGAVDVDGDGDPDLLVVSDLGGVALLRNDGGTGFTDVTAASGLDAVFAPVSVASADVDDDGDADLYFGGKGISYLMINDGAGRFEDATAVWLPEDADNLAVRGSATFGDFDGDGDVDLYQANFYQTVPFVYAPPPNRLYRNTGGAFSLVTGGPAGTEGDASASLVSAWHDFNGDGWLDLWVVNDWGPYLVGNQLFLSLGPDEDWAFEEQSAAFGFDQAVFGMAASLGDVDNDGDLDGYVTNVANNLLLIRDEAGHAEDRAVDFGVADGVFSDADPVPGSAPEWPDLDPDSTDEREAGMAVFCETYCDSDSGMWVQASWSALFFDADQDGWLDLFVTNGIVDTGVLPDMTGQPNSLFLNQGGSGFSRADTDVFPTFRGTSRGAVTLDFDGDGDLDLAWIDNGLDGPPGVHLAENQLSRGHWVQIALDGSDAGNRDAIGAQVVLTAGGQTQIRELDGGRDFLSTSQRVAHFGLGDVGTVDAVEVRWPDGTIDQHDGVPVDQQTVIRR